MDHGQMQDHHSNELPENCFYAKTWQENEEIAAEALASGWFKERRTCQSRTPVSSGRRRGNCSISRTSLRGLQIPTLMSC
jgi:hypothetical protein